MLNISSQNDVQIQRIRAISLTVVNRTCSLDFYTQAFGFELVSDLTIYIRQSLST
jgi:hypothetical protein